MEYAKKSPLRAHESGYFAYACIKRVLDNQAETFIANGLSKVLKINNICGKDNVADCGLPAQITDGTGSKIELPTNAAGLYAKNIHAWNVNYPNFVPAAFETANGESILTFYNRDCKPFDVIDIVQGSLTYRQVPAKMCVNFVYDLNGKKGPNTYGKDIGIITAFYSTDPVVVAPYTHSQGGEYNVDWREGARQCRDFDSEYRMPNLEEMMALRYNSNLVGLPNDSRYWTSKLSSANSAWSVSYTLNITETPISNSASSYDELPNAIKCVKR